MANVEHMAILNKGVEAWNRWRKENPDITPDLSEANLVSANLRQADFHGSNLCRINLSYADLIAADFSEANLCSSNLQNAYLCMANLHSANLKSADLSFANLGCANCSSANLNGALLRMTQAVSTDFSHANLTGVCVENWSVDGTTNLKNTICEHVYLRARWSTHHRKFVFLRQWTSKKRKVNQPCV